MDMSKLPRLSHTTKEDAPAAPAADPAPAEPLAYAGGEPTRPAPREDYRGYEPGVGAEVWISIAVGVIVLLMSGRFWQYAFNRGNFTWTFNDAQGNPLAYPQTVFFWGDLAMVAFGFVLVLEGIVLAIARRPMLVAAAMTFTILVTMLNVSYLIVMMTRGYGLQIMSAFAVAFGVYIALSQWNLLKAARPVARG